MSAPIIRLQDVSKFYKIYRHDLDRVREILTGKSRHEFHYALQDINLEVSPGEVIGVVGRNGAGKSTLLKLLANTMQPSSGAIEINGRTAALLELGASFHPEMSGHENIYLNCSIQGLSRKETDRIYEDIVEFSGIREFIHRPVKTYSSGMFIRLAFAISTHIDPDILIIDEALSVGDGMFARKSFDRIMDFKRAGKTIFFCSHSLYQVEALCDRVLWMEHGRIRLEGGAATVITAYSEYLRMQSARSEQLVVTSGNDAAPADIPASDVPYIKSIEVRVDGHLAKAHKVQSGESSVKLDICFFVGRNLPMPSLGVTIMGGDGRIVSSVGSFNDSVTLEADQQGMVRSSLVFPEFPLMKGNYGINVYLMCEKGLHIYEAAIEAAELNVVQRSAAPGIVELPRSWS